MINKILNLILPPILKKSVFREIINKRIRDKDILKYENNFFDRRSFINRAISNKNLKDCNYLEIGVCKNEVFNTIPLEIKNKIGVDPVEGGTHRMESDEFFSQNSKIFDVIFIDGLHTYEQCQKDCINSLKFLRDDGIIFLHDLLPKNSFEAAVPRKQTRWTGDVWKVAAELTFSENLKFRIANIDNGVGILKKKKNYSYNKLHELKFSNFADYKSRYLKKFPIIDCIEAMEFIDNG